MSANTGSAFQCRAKFPRTRREEFLQYWGRSAAEGENSRLGLVKYASCDPDTLQPYPIPSATGSITAISLDQAPRGQKSRWNKEGYFGGDRDVPLAANEESWSEMRTYGTEPSIPTAHTRSVGEHLADGSPSRRDTSISSIESPPLLSISQVGLNGYNYGPVTPYSEKSFPFQPDNDEVFAEPSPDANRSRLYFNNVAQFLSYDPARLDPIREADEYLLREAARSEQNEQASDFDILCYSLGILFFLANVGSDIALAIKYFTAEEYVYFALTVCFVAIPAICMTVFSAILYHQDRKIMSKQSSACTWVWRVLCHTLLVAPLIRLIETLAFGLKSRQDEGWRENRKNYKYMLDEDVDLTLIRLFENFLENAPQLTLQLYIVFVLGTEKDYMLVTLQITGIITSWISLAWSFVSFATALRNSNPGKAKMKSSSKITLFLWRFFTIGARMTALAVFAASFGFWATLGVIGGHLVVMTIWMLQQNSVYCSVEVKDEEGNIKISKHQCKEYFFRIMAAFIQIFTFFNISEGRTRLRSFVFYTLILIENIIMIIAWYITSATKTEYWYRTPAIIMVILGFCIGIFFQFLYYKCFHPIHYSKEHEHMTIPWWVPCEELSMVGPYTLEGNKEAGVPSKEQTLRSPETRTPIYNPPSKPSSVSDKTSMAGVYRPSDNTLDLNDSLGYRPGSIHRNEVPQARAEEAGDNNEDIRTPKRNDEEYSHRSPPRVKEMSRSPERSSPSKSAEQSPRSYRGYRGSPRLLPRGTPPPPISSPDHSSPARSLASTGRTLESAQGSEDNLSISETSQDVSYKTTTV